MSASWWRTVRQALLGRRPVPAPAAAPSVAETVADRLAPSLLPAARDMLRRRLDGERTPPRTVDDLLGRVAGWSVGAAVAEDRGGYPGGSNRPGWSRYVAEQRGLLAIYRAAAAVSGDADDARRAYFRSLDETVTPSCRLMGDGYEPHVDEEAGRLLYGFPVDSSFVGTAFSFEIGRADLDVLLSDPYRRAVLEVVAHTTLQRAMGRGSKPVTAADFAATVSSVLHSTPEALRRFVAGIDREHNINTGFFVAQCLARRPQG